MHERPHYCPEKVIRTFVAPAKAGVQAKARTAPRLLLDLRPTPTTVLGNVIPTFVAPAEAGVQAYARMARRIFAWIPAYAGTTMWLSLANLEARGCSRFFGSMVVSVIFSRTVVRRSQSADRDRLYNAVVTLQGCN